MEAGPRWRPDGAPDSRIDLGDVVVRRWTIDDAAALHEAVTASTEHLRPWMPWIAHEPLSVRDRENLIAGWSAAWDERSDFTVGVFSQGRVIGGSGLHLRGPDGVLEIGYWVRSGCTGSGIATRVVRALADSAWRIEGVVGVEIHHDSANVASGRVAEKAGFSLLREYQREPQAPAESGRARVWVSQRGR